MEIDIKRLLEETNSLYKKWYLDLERILQDCLNPKHLYGINHADTPLVSYSRP